jgi:hypothetical protein
MPIHLQVAQVILPALFGWFIARFLPNPVRWRFGDHFPDRIGVEDPNGLILIRLGLAPKVIDRQTQHRLFLLQCRDPREIRPYALILERTAEDGAEARVLWRSRIQSLLRGELLFPSLLFEELDGEQWVLPILAHGGLDVLAAKAFIPDLDDRFGQGAAQRQRQDDARFPHD